ncbi:MAG: hypothetical protein IJ174_07700, partial [Clostridia bacterium]|nr:hypothetical protein [Clostridia bacterium]
ATEIARAMVTKFGMSEKLGTMYLANDQEVFVGMEFGQTREYSEGTANEIDSEVRRILTDCYAQALAILREHMTELNGLGELLIEKETVNRADFLRFIESCKPAAELPGEGAVQ